MAGSRNPVQIGQGFGRSGATNLAGLAQKWNGHGKEKAEIKTAQMFCEVTVAELLGPRPGHESWGNQHADGGLPHAVKQIDGLIPQQRVWFETQRKAGQILAGMPLSPGGQPEQATGTSLVPVEERPPRLADRFNVFRRRNNLTWSHHLEVAGLAPEIKVRAERCAGESLREMDKQHGARTPQRDAPTESRPPRLADIGITPKQSMHWQAETSVHEPVYRQQQTDPAKRGILGTA